MIFRYLVSIFRQRVVHTFSLRDKRASETRVSVKITPCEKGLATRSERDPPRRVSLFLAWDDFHARSRFAPSTIPEEK